jgi:hypothetical protein
LSPRPQSHGTRHDGNHGRTELDRRTDGTRRHARRVVETFRDTGNTTRVDVGGVLLHKRQRSGRAVPNVIQSDTPAVTRSIVPMNVRGFRPTRDGNSGKSGRGTVGDKTVIAEPGCISTAEIIGVVTPIGNCRPGMTGGCVNGGVGPATIPSGAHIATVEVHAGMLVARINFTVPTNLVEIDGVDNLLELGLVVDPRAVTPLFFRHQKREGHVFIGVLGAVNTDAVTRRVDLPVHQVPTRGIRHPLHGVFIHAVESNFVGHLGRDEHTVTNTLGNSIVGVLGTLNAIAIGTSRITSASHADVRDKLSAPIAVESLGPSVGQGRGGAGGVPIVIKIPG